VNRPPIISLEGLTTDVFVPELPETFAPPAADAELRAAAEGALEGLEGAYSVVVQHLGDGRSAALNEDQVYYAASLFKLGVLLEVYRQRDAGEVDFEEPLTLTEEYAAYDFGTLELLGLEEDDMLTVADAVKAMIVVSDTPTAVLVQDLVTVGRINATLRSLGIEDTSFATRELPATAKDIALLLRAIAAGDGVSEESRLEMLGLLLQESIRMGIPNPLPPAAAVAHKTGNFNQATHDVAIVWGPAGPYVLALLTDRSWDSEPIAAVSEAVWEYFASHP
jgi:beta-lactamase class A